MYEVKSTCGNSHLGGVDLDNELMKYCINEFKKKTIIDISNNKKAINRLKNECEIGKRTADGGLVKEHKKNTCHSGNTPAKGSCYHNGDIPK